MMVSVCAYSSVVVEFMTCLCCHFNVHVYFLFKGTHTSCHPLLSLSLSLFLLQRSSANVKIFSEPMPYSNERSISLSGTEEQIAECVTFFLQEIGQVLYTVL